MYPEQGEVFQRGWTHVHRDNFNLKANQAGQALLRGRYCSRSRQMMTSTGFSGERRRTGPCRNALGGSVEGWGGGVVVDEFAARLVATGGTLIARASPYVVAGVGHGDSFAVLYVIVVFNGCRPFAGACVSLR